MKLSKKDFDLLWGDGGPYSEAKIAINSRIIDDYVSRVMVEVTGNVNPTTYKIIKAHREEFLNDRLIQELLDTARYTSPEYGYVVSLGTEEMSDPKAMDRAQIKLDSLTETLIKMHEFVMEKLGIENRHENEELPEGISKDQIDKLMNDQDLSDDELFELAKIFNQAEQKNSKSARKK